MAQLLGSSSGLVHHGCLVVRRADGSGDVSDWDPTKAAFYNAGDAVIFGVRPEVAGSVHVEVWEGVPDHALEHVLFSECLDGGAERIVLSDPNNVLSVEFDGSPERMTVEVRVDDVGWPGRVQVIVSPDVDR
jgi:hypothetical protein